MCEYILLESAESHIYIYHYVLLISELITYDKMSFISDKTMLYIIVIYLIYIQLSKVDYKPNQDFVLYAIIGYSYYNTTTYKNVRVNKISN
jgi:hypothetical protein